MNRQNNNKSGFTIVELILAGAVSISMLALGYTIIQVGLKGNKIDETQMGLSGKLNDTLDFILDEIKVGKRLIEDESEVTSLNSNCTFPNDGEFIFGIRLPDQALVEGDYSPEGNLFNLSQVECPIVYTLRPSNSDEKKPYTLVRYGPQYDKKGYYISPSFQDFKETVLLDGITGSGEYKKIECPDSWIDNLKTIKGITFCIDEYKKSIEIQIEAEDPQTINNKDVIKSIASTGGFSTIQDERQLNLRPPNLGESSNTLLCNGGNCCWLGVCLKSNKVTYMIDRSFVMDERYIFHPNGSIIDGEWVQNEENPEISPRINGQSLFKSAKYSLKRHIEKLPASDITTGGKKISIQVIAFSGGDSRYLFGNVEDPRPRELTSDRKINAIDFINKLPIDSSLSINPWLDICKTIEQEYVGQIIILSASRPLSSEITCFGKTGSYDEIINDYNMITRSKSNIGSLIIDSISYFHNFCESSKNYYQNNWLGLVSSGAESMCAHIK